MRIILLSLFLSSVGVVSAQPITPILERKISIELVNEKLPTALEQIGRLASFSFSYNSDIISSSRLVSLKAIDKTVRQVLDELFNGSIQYKEKARHLILTQAPLPSQPNHLVILISGYVEDGKSGERIPNASVFEKSTLTSSVTNQSGYFKIKLDHFNGSSLELDIRKKNYRDTAVVISTSGNSSFTISITPLKTSSLLTVSQIESLDSSKRAEKIQLRKLELPYESDANIQNIHDTLYSKAQISFLPFLGTNGKLSGNVINDYSFNVLGGYSYGTKRIEVGGFVNIDRKDVSWLQLAGFGNMVGRHVYGVQGAGFFNLNGGETKAVQLAGFANVNFGETRGVQLAGFANTNLSSTHAVQIAGFYNFSNGQSVGVQVAGFGNVQLGEYQGSQVSGFFNFNKENIHGAQVAGFANIATGEVEGSQVATFFNYGKRIKGTQVGVFNAADTLGGVPLGLISFVRHGYHKLEFSSDEVFHINASFRTGVKDFYNILVAGIKPDQTPDGANVWTFGYGIGTARKITPRLYFNIDVTSQHINKGSFTHAVNLLNKVHAGFDYQLAKKFSVYAGATLNGYLTENTFTDYPDLFSSFHPSVFYDQTVGDSNNLKMWIGWKVGVRFF